MCDEFIFGGWWTAAAFLAMFLLLWTQNQLIKRQRRLLEEMIDRYHEVDAMNKRIAEKMMKREMADG